MKSRTTTSIILLALFPFGLFASQQSSQSQPAQPALAEDQSSWIQAWRDSTVSLGQVINDGGTLTYYVVGSGLLVGVGEHKGGIITAKHVVFDPEQGWHPAELKMRLSWQEHKSITEELGIVLPLMDQHGSNLWTSTSDGSDLVFVPLPSATSFPEAHRDMGAIWPSAFAADSEFFEGAQVVVLGFPIVMGPKYLVRPIVRNGIVAWVNPDAPATRPFLVDSNLYPGNSGGPVIKVPVGLNRYGELSFNRKVTLLGIVSQGPYQNAVVSAEGRPLPFIDPTTHRPAAITAKVIAVGGIALIEPVSEVRKLLDQVFGAGSSQSSPPAKTN